MRAKRRTGLGERHARAKSRGELDRRTERHRQEARGKQRAGKGFEVNLLGAVCTSYSESCGMARKWNNQ